MKENIGGQAETGRSLRPNAQMRGLALLIGVALVASGLVQFGSRLRTPTRIETGEFVYENVEVIAVDFIVRGKVNVNVDPIEELIRLRGVGEVIASRIIAYREEHGPFASLDDLDAVSGIGPATIEGFRDQACIEQACDGEAQ